MKKRTSRTRATQPKRNRPVQAESIHIALETIGKRVKLVVQSLEGKSVPRELRAIELSQRAAGRLGRALVRKDAEITGIAGVKPVVADSISLAILHQIHDTLTSRLGDGARAVDRNAVALAAKSLSQVLCRIDSGASHG